MYIGSVSKTTGASRRAIRLYEEKGLIPPPAHRGNYRFYDEASVKAVALIKSAQEAGFSLAELRDFINKKTRENRFPVEMAAELIELEHRACRKNR